MKPQLSVASFNCCLFFAYNQSGGGCSTTGEVCVLPELSVLPSVDVSPSVLPLIPSPHGLLSITGGSVISGSKEIFRVIHYDIVSADGIAAAAVSRVNRVCSRIRIVQLAIVMRQLVFYITHNRIYGIRTHNSKSRNMLTGREALPDILYTSRL